MATKSTKNEVFPAAGLDSLLDGARSNFAFALQAQQLALKGAADLLGRQMSAWDQTYDRWRSLTTNGAWPKRLEEVPAYQRECAKAGLQCAAEHVKVFVDSTVDTNKAVYDAAQKQVKNLARE